jgi:acetyl esterase
MTLDPDAQRVIEMAKASTAPLYEQVDPATARELYKKGRRVLQPEPQAVAEVRALTAPGPHGPIPLRAYYPASRGETPPVLVYFHGGGWVIGDLDSHDGVCRHLANASGCVVVSVDYRMGPEAKFPAAVDDAMATTRWVSEQAGALGVATNRLAVGGDSAGGNLAAVVALMARDAGGPAIAFQVLFYPATDLSMAGESQRRLAEGYLLTVHNQRWFHGHYLRGEADKADWRASPAKAGSLKGLPPAYVLTAGYDPLCDEGQAYAEAMKAAGVPVQLSHYAGQIHGFLTMGGVIKASGAALDEAGAALHRALGAA